MALFVPRRPVFRPTISVITAITNSNPAVVTTLNNNNYIDGIIVRLDIPTGFGMVQANQLFGAIVVLSPTTFSIAIDTTLFDIFIIPIAPILMPATSLQQAQAIPFAEINDILTAAVQNVLPS
jgi:hypothetical protein